MKLTVNLKNLKRLPNVIAKVEKYRDELPKKQEKFLQKLADIGVTDATARFEQAEYDGDNDVVVHSPEWINDNTVAIRASGNSVLFIEFGTGVYYSKPVHEKAAELGFIRGEYGEHRGKNDSWYYKGEPGTNGQIPSNPKLAARGLVFTHGNPANRCMWETDKRIRTQIIEIAKEVFA